MRSYKNLKYFLSNFALKSSLKNLYTVERSWLKRYLEQDARILKLAKQHTNIYILTPSKKFSLKKAQLRSSCYFSRKNSAISKYFFWSGRHVLNSYFKTGRIAGFKKS